MDDVAAATATATSSPPPPQPSPSPSLPYTQAEIDEDHVCDSKYRDLITLDFATEHPRLYRGRYFERESLQRLLAQHDGAAAATAATTTTTIPFIIQRVRLEDGTVELRRLAQRIKNPVPSHSDDSWVPRAEIEAAINNVDTNRWTTVMIGQAVERYHEREERRDQFESMRKEQSQQAEFDRSLQQQFAEIAEHRQRRLHASTTTIPEVAALQQELDGIMNRCDLGGFQQRAHILRRIEILENEQAQAEFRRLAREEQLQQRQRQQRIHEPSSSPAAAATSAREALIREETERFRQSTLAHLEETRRISAAQAQETRERTRALMEATRVHMEQSRERAREHLQEVQRVMEQTRREIQATASSLVSYQPLAQRFASNYRSSSMSQDSDNNNNSTLPGTLGSNRRMEQAASGYSSGSSSLADTSETSYYSVMSRASNSSSSLNSNSSSSHYPLDSHRADMFQSTRTDRPGTLSDTLESNRSGAMGQVTSSNGSSSSTLADRLETYHNALAQASSLSSSAFADILESSRISIAQVSNNSSTMFEAIRDSHRIAMNETLEANRRALAQLESNRRALEISRQALLGRLHQQEDNPVLQNPQLPDDSTT